MSCTLSTEVVTASVEEAWNTPIIGSGANLCGIGLDVNQLERVEGVEPRWFLL
jgi:hypothetical protein